MVKSLQGRELFMFGVEGREEGGGWGSYRRCRGRDTAVHLNFVGERFLLLSNEPLEGYGDSREAPYAFQNEVYLGQPTYLTFFKYMFPTN